LNPILFKLARVDENVNDSREFISRRVDAYMMFASANCSTFFVESTNIQEMLPVGQSLMLESASGKRGQTL
jgi:hypothetical protein